MRKLILILLLLVLSLSGVTYAIEGKITASFDYSFYDRWYRTQSSTIPLLTDAEQVSHKQYFYLYLFFGGYKADTSGNANVTYDLTILKPDSSLYNTQKNIPAAAFKIVDSTMTLLANANLRISFEPEDSLGEYLIKALIKDNVSGDTVTAMTRVELTKFERINSVTNDSLLTNWMQSYYQHFRSELAIDAFIQFSKSPHRDNVAYQSFCFYHELFTRNQHLIPKLKNEFRIQSDTVRADIILLLAYLNDDDPLFMEQLNQEENYLYQSNVGADSLFTINKISNPFELDVLWLKFFSSGSYQPIRTLVDALELVRHKGAIEKFQQSDQDPALEADAYLEATYRSLIWSLDVNSKNYKLVQDYLSFIYNREQLPDTVKSELKLILSK